MKERDEFSMEQGRGGLPARKEDCEGWDAPSFVTEAQKGRGRSGAWVLMLALCLLVMSFFLFYAMMLMLSGKESTGDEPVTDPLRAEADRIVYVRQWEEDSGLLSTPEIYEASKRGVVTVCGVDEKGDRMRSFGFLLSEDGYITTVSSVLREAVSLSVRLWDGREYSALRVGVLSEAEVGLLKIEERGLSPLPLGRSESLLMGERVVAVAEGLVSTGELSSLSERLLLRDASGLLQRKLIAMRIQAYSLQGYAGAPLLNEYGEVVGMVTDHTETEGRGYALPIHRLTPILACLMAGDEISSEVLCGVVIDAPELSVVGGSASEGGMLGVRIWRFSSGSSSAAAMLRAGDLILSVDGVAVRCEEEIARAIEEKDPGEGVFVSVLRFGQILTFEVILS